METKGNEGELSVFSGRMKVWGGSWRKEGLLLIISFDLEALSSFSSIVWVEESLSMVV